MEEPQPPVGSPISPIARLVSFLAGVFALVVGAIITIGAALVGAIAIGIAAVILRRKQRRITRRGAWFTGVAATIAAFAMLIGWGVLATQPEKMPTAAERAEQRARATQSMPDWVKTMNPNAQKQTQAADSMAAALLENRAVMIWAGMMGTVIASALIGTIAGSFAWVGVMLLNRSFTGNWLPSTGSPTTGL